MNNKFIKIVRNYEAIGKLGREIIKYKKPIHFHYDFQHKLRVEQFIKEIDTAAHNLQANTSTESKTTSFYSAPITCFRDF